MNFRKGKPKHICDSDTQGYTCASLLLQAAPLLFTSGERKNKKFNTKKKKKKKKVSGKHT